MFSQRPPFARCLAAFACVILCVQVVPSLLSAQEASDPNRTCFMCHGDPENFAGREDGERLIVTRDEFEGSVHGGFGFSCTTCHSSFTFPHPEEYAPVQCGMCHGGESRQYGESVHGYALARGNDRAPTCAGCHGEHDIRRSDDPESHTYHTRVAETCTECHGTAGLLTDQYLKLPSPGAQFARSVHGQAGEAGDMEAATCTDCHGVHDLRGHNDPNSRINRLNVSTTCGACHSEISAEYDRSIHGRALKAGIGDSPTCTDCHGEHLILHPDDPEAGTNADHLAADLCGDCHNDPVIIAKYSLRDDVVASYTDSYHGWATERDHGHAATCVSCHTAHLVLPTADPASSISEGNVVATCQQCHEGASAEFARSYDHAAASSATNKGRRIVTALYIGLIIVVIGGMALHNALILNYYLVEKRRREKSERGVVRFDKIQIAQHMLLALSFILLVLTGFALRYPEALWVKWTGLAFLSETVRSWSHRILGVGLILFSVVHVLYILFARRGREEFNAMLPNFQDIKDFIDNMSFHTWVTKRKPRFGRYDYTQKAEYWALVWGTALMAITGLVLWFPVLATSWAPAWIVSISETIHFYEAWLAMLAIVVWHFFFVMVHPDVYPMSWIWLTGKMPEHEVQAVHGRWYDEEVAEMLAALPPGETTAGLPGQEAPTKGPEA
jgi:formate dehydrogenase gamma subunit